MSSLLTSSSFMKNLTKFQHWKIKCLCSLWPRPTTIVIYNNDEELLGRQHSREGKPVSVWSKEKISQFCNWHDKSQFEYIWCTLYQGCENVTIWPTWLMLEFESAVTEFGSRATCWFRWLMMDWSRALKWRRRRAWKKNCHYAYN